MGDFTRTGPNIRHPFTPQNPTYRCSNALTTHDNSLLFLRQSLLDTDPLTHAEGEIALEQVPGEIDKVKGRKRAGEKS